MLKPLNDITRGLLVPALVLAASFTCGAEKPAVADVALPGRAEIFAVAFEPQPAGTPPYFDEPSFLALYPALHQANVKIAAGARRIWQRGVIVTKEKKVLFWSTCAKTFIAVETGEGQRFFATEAEVFVQ